MKTILLDRDTADEVANLIETEIEFWRDDHGDPGNLPEQAEELVEQLRKPLVFLVEVLV